MEKQNALARLLGHPRLYRMWQAPFAEKKLAVMLSHPSVRSARRVLDVGCGPGTSTAHFAHAEYMGIDLNERYIAYARKKFGRAFEVADVTTWAAPATGSYDLILLNSLLHHIDDSGVDHILGQLSRFLSAEGRVHILDLVMPTRRGLPRALARADRGEHPRSVQRWREIFGRHFDEETFEPYPLGLARVTLWEMIYFRGRKRR